MPAARRPLPCHPRLRFVPRGLALVLVPLLAVVLGPVFTPTAAQAQDRWATPGPWSFDTQFGEVRISVVVEGLEDPWSLAFLPDATGDFLVTEKPGRLRRVRGGVLDPDPVPGVPPVRFAGQGGLLEVALHPEFRENRILYLSYAKLHEDGVQGTTALARARYEDDRLHDLEEIFVAEAWSGGGAHFGGKIAFDGAGHLFLSIGDRGANPLAGPREAHASQDLRNHQGTIVRLRLDGSVPADNPFVNHPDHPEALPEIWSFGHRNPQGLLHDPATGRLWSTEHGAQGGDELNLVEGGRNYGWPVIGYGVQYGGAPIHTGTHREGMEQPVQFWTPSIAPSGLHLYTGDRFPAWRGHLLAGGLDGQQVARIPIVENDDGSVRVGRMERPSLFPGFARIRDIREGPDGALYLVIDDRREGRLTPVVRVDPAGGEDAEGRTGSGG